MCPEKHGQMMWLGEFVGPTQSGLDRCMRLQ